MSRKQLKQQQPLKSVLRHLFLIQDRHYFKPWGSFQSELFCELFSYSKCRREIWVTFTWITLKKKHLFGGFFPTVVTFYCPLGKVPKNTHSRYRIIFLMWKLCNFRLFSSAYHCFISGARKPEVKKNVNKLLKC